MIEYLLTGVEGATMSADRSRFDIEFKTRAGPLVLCASAAHLGTLITCLQKFEHQALLLDPAKGQLPGEPAQNRPKVVDDLTLQRGEVNRVPGLLLGIKVGQEVRWYARDSAMAEVLRRGLGDEIQELS